jgi:outer membrane biosynthesis protein TonB
VPSAAVRFAFEAVFLVLVALGAGLARLDPLAIIGLMAVAWVLVALVERASAREAERAAAGVAGEGVEPEPELPHHVDLVTAEETAVSSEPEAPPELEPALAVSERSARAILASGPPPLPEPPRPKPARQATVESEPEPELEPQLEPEPEPKPEPEPESELEPQPEPEQPAKPVYSGAQREWNIWQLERLVRERPDDERHEELAALLLSLRDFANADGTLPAEFDDLMRESFGPLVASADEATETAAAP